MARIRTVKPEFWEDEILATISRDARLLFIATFNMADDEGLLRWTPEYIKANAFMYDDDLAAADVEKLMQELAAADLVLPYRAGRPQRQLAWVITFRRHQNINRPQPSKLPPPSIQSGEVLTAYKRRDRMTCHLCGGTVSERHDERRLWPSLDHVIPRSKGGSDYPSNIKLSHYTCNVARRDRDPGESPSQHAPGPAPPPPGSVNHSVNDSLNGSESDPNDLPHGSLNTSLLEEEGDQGGDQGSGIREVPRAHAIPNAPEPRFTEVPDDFQPTDAMRRWAHSTHPGLDLDFETAQFVRHFRSEGKRKKSWVDAWQKWIADSHKRLTSPRASPAAASHQPRGQPASAADQRRADVARLREIDRQQREGHPASIIRGSVIT